MTDRVDRMRAWLAEHRAELEAAEAGQLHFAWHQGDLRVDLTVSRRLARDGHPAHPAAGA